jgi:hypothetical protein
MVDQGRLLTLKRQIMNGRSGAIFCRAPEIDAAGNEKRRHLAVTAFFKPGRTYGEFEGMLTVIELGGTFGAGNGLSERRKIVPLLLGPP